MWQEFLLDLTSIVNCGVAVVAIMFVAEFDVLRGF